MKLNVANKSCIRRIGFRHMKSAPARNLIAILAIALTSILFTAIFTVVSSILYSFEMSNFRQVGGYAHGAFKYLNREQIDELKDDPLIKQYGIRHILGIAPDEPFQKSQVEISYKDAQEAAFSFIEPIEGGLPKEGTNEAATDTKVLSLLGVPAKLGEEFTLSFVVDGIKTTETFTLCGYWEYDEAITANDVLLPESRVNEILDKLDISYADGISGTYEMDVMFRNTSHIEENLITVLENHGYKVADDAASDNSDQDGQYIRIGVNWGYLGAQLDGPNDLLTVAAIVLVLLIIIFTGYLIIYNVFQISVSNDIRFYGLLKTIGTTGRQMKRIVRMQALFLSVVGIPIGIAAGYVIGALMLPLAMSETTLTYTKLSANPLIFIASALFSLVTVTISCRKPGKMAAKVSPIEAIRYSEGTSPRRKIRHTRQGASLTGMALANLGRNRKRTAVTILSLSLSALLLNITVTFTGGFDMEKYVSLECITDFHIAHTNYYSVFSNLYYEEMAVPELLIEQIQEQDGITDGGRTYGDMSFFLDFMGSIPEDLFREKNSYGLSQMTDADREDFIDTRRNAQGQIMDGANLYGMEPFCLDQLQIVDGDLSKLYDKGNYIAAVYHEDDYGNPELDTHWAKVGDTVSIRYVEREWHDPNTEEIIENPLDYMYQPIGYRDVDYHDVEYEVVATVTVPNTMTYRFFGDYDYVLNSETFKKDSDTDTVLYYAFDTEEDAIPAMEQFLTDYTSGAGSQFDFESRQKTIDDFSSMQNTYLIAGSILSFIVGLIGVLNFLNTILTGILTRHREFAVLQSVGMTGRQLKQMLISEGVLYAVITIVFSFVLIVATAPFVSSVLNASFWFFTYRFTALPAIAMTPFFLLLGILTPLITYRFASGKSIVERLREAE